MGRKKLQSESELTKAEIAKVTQQLAIYCTKRRNLNYKNFNSLEDYNRTLNRINSDINELKRTIKLIRLFDTDKITVGDIY